MENKELLTGRCKADFNKFLNKKRLGVFGFHHGLGEYFQVQVDSEHFDKCPKTMQQGVLLEFFRERGYEIYWEVRSDRLYDFYVWRISAVPATRLDPFEFNQGFTTAIQKACEIINGKELK